MKKNSRRNFIVKSAACSSLLFIAPLSKINASLSQSSLPLHFIDEDKCVGCGQCVDEAASCCPVEALIFDAAKGKAIITGECIDCGACDFILGEICCADAIFIPQW